MAWMNKGAIFRDLQNIEMAHHANEKALELSPKNPNLWFNKALIESDLLNYSKAVLAYSRAKELGAQNEYLLGNLIHARMLIADWKSIETQLSDLLDEVKKRRLVVMPFTLMAMIDDPSVHLEAAKLYVQKAARNLIPLGNFKKHPHSKIRIGYFSSDLRAHPVGRLIGEVVELHDRNRFEVYGFSLIGSKEDDVVRRRLVSAFDHFIHCQGQSDGAIVAKAREYEIDIAIDLNGHTQDNRPSIFALGVAPIQINYLGYPGTMGANFMDYIIADKTIIPSDSHQFYTEKVAYLPNSYLMYDSLNKVPAQIPTRAAIGIPDDVFVFCGFNNGYKISKGVVKSWIKILLSVENSILWLTGENTEFKKNILMEFSSAGVPSERIIFAPRVERIEDHLARLKQADLFLDAWPYNAHSTGMDVLNAGVPILTKVGKSFAARVGASLLTSLNLPELIAHSTHEYEAKAIQLANNPALLKEIKAKVQDQNARSKLFDTKQFTLGLESLYKQMYELKQAGLPAEHLYADS
jgi:predicted O-linked N-acetylglucosamine transferase (SPINDLY family)